MEVLKMSTMLINERKARHWTQVDLAKALLKTKVKPGYDVAKLRSWIANIESGRSKKLYPHELVAFAKAFGKPDNYFSVIGSAYVEHEGEEHKVTMMFSESKAVSVVEGKILLEPFPEGHAEETAIVGVILRKR